MHSMNIKRIVEESDTPAGRVFDIAVLLLILLSVVSFSLETLPTLSPRQQDTLRWIEVVTVSLFTAEYLLRIVVASSRLGFLFSFFGLIDLLAILPFYLAVGVDLRTIRAFRLLRIIRILRFVRYTAAVRRLHRAAVIAREEVLLFLGAALLGIYVSAVGVFYFEHAAQPEVFASIFHGLWWAVITLTTVGYGDAVPITIGGRLFTTVILLVGLGIVAVPTGLIASALEQARDEEKQGGAR